MDYTFDIISFTASIISIISFFLSFPKNKKINKIFYIITFILAIATSISHIQYKRVTDKQLNIERRKQEFKNEAKNILNSSPTYINYWDPGQNAGMLYAVLILLENYKDLYPEMYETYKIDVISKIKKHNSNDDPNNRQQMETAAKTALQILKSLAE